MFHRPKSDIKETVQQKPVQQQLVSESEEAKDVAPVVREAAMAKTTTETPQPKKQFQAKEEKSMSNEQTESRETETRAEAPAAPFQRPPQMQRSVPGAFPGSYASSASAASPYDRAASSDERRLVIGQGITLSGEIEACDYLLVEGTLEAALKGAKILDVAASGTFYGAVEIEEATIAGRFEGDLTVNGRLTIKSGGSVTGTIAYKELMVEAGATLDGKVSPLAASGAARSEAAPKQTKSMAPRNDNAGDEESDSNELPFAGRAAAAE